MIELAHAGVGGAAIVDHLDLRKQPERIGGAPHRIGADLEALAARAFQFVYSKPRPQHQHIARGIALERCADHQPRGVLVARHVLERMHRGVQFSRPDGIANFGHKCAALAAVRQQLAGLVQIARGLELDDFDLDTGNGRGETPGNLRGLRQCHGALSRADPQSNCHHSCSNHCARAEFRGLTVSPEDRTRR